MILEDVFHPFALALKRLTESGDSYLTSELGIYRQTNIHRPESSHTMTSIDPKKQVAIDEVDAIILSNLLRESRTSFSKIAEECKITVTSVTNRYRRLHKEGIIKGEIMQVNPHSLGYHCVTLIGIISQKHKETDLLNYFEKGGNNFNSVKFGPVTKYVKFGTFAKYIATTGIALKNVGELATVQRSLESNRLIKRADVFISSLEIVTPDHPENLIVSPCSGRIEYKKTEIKPVEVEMDEIDRKIARILAERSRTPFGRIGEELGITTKTVIQRYRKIRGNVLTLSTITIDLNKLGYTAGALLLIRLENKLRTTEIMNQLLAIPNLIHLNNFVGPFDLLAHIVFKSFSEYFQIMERIRIIEGIDEMEISLVPGFPVWPHNGFANLL
jgi:Lrp/AsnC family transcriptional regulator for asnA, asnC and gidA